MDRTRHYFEYEPTECVVFCKTRENWGGLSNMAAGYPLYINGETIRTVEALYQACRFPKHSSAQRKIINERSPMSAKMKGKPFRKEFCRPDWDDVRVEIMEWCLRVKLTQNFSKFGQLLRATGDSSIVERSYKDDFWGARPGNDGRLYGENQLGRLLVKVRERVWVQSEGNSQIVEPPDIGDFLLFGKRIEPINGENDRDSESANAPLRTNECSTMLSHTTMPMFKS